MKNQSTIAAVKSPPHRRVVNPEAIHKTVVLARRERGHGRRVRNGGGRARSLDLTLQAKVLLLRVQAIALRALARVLRELAEVQARGPAEEAQRELVKDPQENLLTLARVVNRAALLIALPQERLLLALLKRKTHAKRARRSPVLLLSHALLHAPLLIPRNARNLSLVLLHAPLLMSRNARSPSLALHHAHLLSRNARNPSHAHLLLRSVRSPFLAPL